MQSHIVFRDGIQIYVEVQLENTLGYFAYIDLCMTLRRSAAPKILDLNLTKDDGDISLASTLPSPKTAERPELGHLRRSSSQNNALPHQASHRKRKSTLTRANDLPTAILPPEFIQRLGEWIECVTIVNFDLDVGPGREAYLHTFLSTS